MPSGNLEGAFILIKSGDAAGKELPVARVLGNTVFVGVNPFGADKSPLVKMVRAGDQVEIDNSDFLAAR